MMSNASNRCSDAMKIQVLIDESKEGPQIICPEFMILGHSLWSHATNMTYFHFSESLFMAKSALETCTGLGIAGVWSVCESLYQSNASLCHLVHQPIS